MDLCSIASGSSGNCIYVGSDRTHLIVDAGISGRKIEAGLNDIGLKTEEMDGILVTHEHSDHIASLGVLARRYGLPMYATKGTIEGILHTSGIGTIPDGLFHEIRSGEPFQISDLTVHPVSISHDAADPVAFRIEHEEKKIGILTDLGTFDEKIVSHFSGVDALLLEANHDVHMLQVGRYPYPLKCRILGERGHLSNELSGRLLCRLLHDRFQT
ncbi:MAG: MBL fold metallo-hydrolase, partial [Lachnospiraceae bacterium]|nr:MBL fold metallo-hydrolase [Lachnospiraceae bacterium]